LPRKSVIAKSACNPGDQYCLAHSGMSGGLISIIRHQKLQNGDIRETKLDVKEIRKEFTEKCSMLSGDINDLKVEAARASNLIWKATLGISGSLILLLVGQIIMLVIKVG
jgi:hypothetical protein